MAKNNRTMMWIVLAVVVVVGFVLIAKGNGAFPSWAAELWPD